jgi:tetratricopeptide (TPR) repeat protein
METWPAPRMGGEAKRERLLVSNKPQSIHDMANHVFNEAIKRANADQFDEAVAIYGNIIDLRPALSAAYQQRGRCHWEMNRWADALKDFQEACRMEPDNNEFAWTLGLMNLQRHAYKEGWRGYSRRWDSKTFKSPRLRTSKPEWYSGIDAKRVLVWPEQGLGDQIIYSSMLPLLAQHAEVTAMVDMRLTNLLARGMPEVNFIPHDARVPMDKHDAHIPLGSLGQHFIHTVEDIDSVASDYILRDRNRSIELAKKYGFDQITAKPIIGLSWQSTAKTIGHHKSCSLKDLEPILEWGDREGFQFLSLQYGDTSELDKYPQIIKPNINMFFDLESVCALMSECEHIISVSNVNVHLAGAMGVRVHLLDANKLWYWNAKDSDGYSLWYPTVKIHPRENMLASWTSPVQNVLECLVEEYE